MPPGRPPLLHSPKAIWIRGGATAPLRARRYVHAQLDDRIPRRDVSIAVVLVSELVTNSVVHADVSDSQTLILELTSTSSRLRIAVTDPGSELEPRVLPIDLRASGGFGLRLVDELSSAWGVDRENAGSTTVWCEVPLDAGPRSIAAPRRIVTIGPPTSRVRGDRHFG
jgi:anti-sigma regulatory factor (Ser/Thr protein kinase)